MSAGWRPARLLLYRSCAWALRVMCHLRRAYAVKQLLLLPLCLPTSLLTSCQLHSMTLPIPCALCSRAGAAVHRSQPRAALPPPAPRRSVSHSPILSTAPPLGANRSLFTCWAAAASRDGASGQARSSRHRACPPTYAVLMRQPAGVIAKTHNSHFHRLFPPSAPRSPPAAAPARTPLPLRATPCRPRWRRPGWRPSRRLFESSITGVRVPLFVCCLQGKRVDATKHLISPDLPALRAPGCGAGRS